ncbi:MAG TPA: CDP-glucose 4,6-dehydratase [Cyclobacteriaceae bacterium]|nr:CDP-glucose 4,6-dehydratase [Cyclobacteriaceae bacterium]
MVGEESGTLENLELNMFGNQFKDKKIIVTGNTGFKGSWLTIWLLKLGAKVIGISRDIPTQPSMFETLGLMNKIDHRVLDIRDLDSMKKVFLEVKPDFLFHLAAQPIVARSYDDPVETISTNVLGTTNILEALRALQQPCSAVIITSDKCYDNVEWIWGYKETDALGGKDPYSASKGAAELIVKTYYQSYFSKPGSLIRIISVRAGNVIGGGDWATSRIVPDCIRAWSENKRVEVRNPNSTRPWQHVLEPLSGYLLGAQALATGAGLVHGEAFNFGPGADQNYTVHKLLERISEFWPKHLEEFYTLNSTQKFKEAGLLKLNCEKAALELHWMPVLEFDQTARFTAEWYLRFYFPETGNDISLFTEEQIEEYVMMAKRKGLQWAQ